MEIEQLCEHSFRDFHVKGFDYLCLHRSEAVTVKAYFFDGPTIGAPEVVMPHNHRYGFTTTVLAGGLANREWAVADSVRVAAREQHTRVFQEFDYLTPLLGGDGFTWRREVLLAEDLLSRGRIYRRGETYLSQPSDIHTLGSIEPGTVIVLTQLEDVVPVGTPTQAYRSGQGHEGPSLDGLYSRMDADHAQQRLAQLDRLGWPVPYVPPVLSRHELYEPKDFTEEEYRRRNQLAVLVIDGGLGICKRCGAGEVELDDYPTCQEYRLARRASGPST